jgi:hypothetical protein
VGKIRYLQRLFEHNLKQSDMRKLRLKDTIIAGSLLFFFFQSCVDDREEWLAKQTPDQSFVEEFKSQQDAFDKGWHFINHSLSLGPTNWNTPSAPPFYAYSTKTTIGEFLWVDYFSTSSPQGVISNWAVSPSVIMQNGDKIIFYTRCELYAQGADSTDYANRLQLRLNTSNDGLNVGNGSDVGDYSNLLLDINPDYIKFSYNQYSSSNPLARDSMRYAYPPVWTKFESTISGLQKPTRGRFAFRYFIENGGYSGKGTSVGIDSVAYIGINKK